MVVIGAGAAGMFAGLFAARAGARVLMLETRRQPGAKIRVSGGGRCNVLPSVATLADYHTTGSTHALRNILMSWSLTDVHRFFAEDLGVPLKVEETGKVFPVSDRSKDVVDALLNALERAHVQLRGEQRVTALAYDAAAKVFHINTASGETFAAQRIILATGGLSMPKTGSDGSGWRIARTLGHDIVAPYPALVPLCTSDSNWHALAGVSTQARMQAWQNNVCIGDETGDVLLTHGGLSGPAALNISRYVTAPEANVQLKVQWGRKPHEAWTTVWQRGGNALVLNTLRNEVPKRLADLLLYTAQVPTTRRLSEFSRPEQQRLREVLEAMPLPISGNEGYRTAEVTAGGIPLAQVHTKTLESKTVAGLYFCGETLDVTGRLGGYNFLWAWVSGRRAGLSAVREPHPVSVGQGLS